jgi:CRISPR-associated protein (TIGR02710 family)
MTAGGALIISVGGTPEPIISSVREHNPAAVVFFCSADTVETVGPIKERLREEGIAPHDAKVLVEDPQDLTLCYEQAIRCAELALAGGRTPADVVVDFTGGTKAMTAALVLATVGRGFKFSYVGGTERTKRGQGVVVTGAEAIVQRGDPFVLFAVEERKRLALFFRTFQFKAAREVVTALLARSLSGPDASAFDMVGEVAKGYECWERFEYRAAHETLGRCAGKWATAVRANPGIRYAPVLPGLQANVAWLKRIDEATGGGARYDALLIADFVANAERRALEGSYDDGIVRLYRALELGAQVAIQRRLRCGTDRVPLSAVPDPLRDEFRERYREPQRGCVEIPMEAAYRLLGALGEPEGRRFEAHKEAFRKVQSARNHSWLAHGMTPGTEGAFRSLRELVCSLLEVRESVAFVELDES